MEDKYMFLGMLNEKEGKNFLELANIAMMANGDEAKEAEKAVLQAFKLELEMQDYVIKNKKQEELVTAFQASTKKIKKAVTNIDKVKSPLNYTGGKYKILNQIIS